MSFICTEWEQIHWVIRTLRQVVALFAENLLLHVDVLGDELVLAHALDKAGDELEHDHRQIALGSPRVVQEAESSDLLAEVVFKVHILEHVQFGEEVVIIVELRRFHLKGLSE